MMGYLAKDWKCFGKAKEQKDQLLTFCQSSLRKKFEKDSLEKGNTKDSKVSNEHKINGRANETLVLFPNRKPAQISKKTSLKQSSKLKNDGIFGRLDDSQSRPKSIDTRSREVSQSDSFIRLHSKQGEIQFNSQSVSDLSGGSFSLRKRANFSNLRENRKITDVNSEHADCKRVAALDFLRILGVMASCIELIPNARLHMRPIQLHLLSFWNPICKDMTVEIPFTQHLKSHLSWWTNTVNTLKG
ncbi:unnamed protein product [Mytilus coruscus]|uniref:Uncharacterized protein n=1 Tax=Mytilus coruscus TaxID=42192 RepID=A0A6J8C961_MYTCO|nr:unnamed protein product [Mytilus coruscus]